MTTTADEVVKLPLGLENIVFEFSFSEDNPLQPPYSPSSPPVSFNTEELEDGLKLQSNTTKPVKSAFPYVQCLIYRTDVPEEYFLWSGTLEVSPPVIFELKYEDEQDVRGSFKQFQSVNFGEYYVFFDVEYGIDYEHHYEGNMVQIPSPTL